MNIETEIIEMALSFIESKEMRECFRNTLLAGNEPDRACSYCCDFIVGSRAGIDEKLSALRKLPPHKETVDLINVAESALAERENATGDIFLVTLHYPYEESKNGVDVSFEREPYHTFEKVLNLIGKETSRECAHREETIEQCIERIWYEVEKFIPDENSDLKNKITWTLNAKGEILFFELGDDFQKHYNHINEAETDGDWRAWLDWESSNDWTYPPVPFDFGDIITIDMRPYYKDFHGIIVRIGDNHDCCSVACVYADEDGFLYCSTLKHNMHKVLSKVSPLYRTERFDGELPENAKMLKTISEAIKKIPSTDKVREDGVVWRDHELAKQFDEFLYSDDYKKKDGYFGCSWEEFKEKFSEVFM